MNTRVHVITVPGASAHRDAIVAKQVAEGDACVHEDPQRMGLMQNWLKAVECASKDSSRWSAILSDDADPLPDWTKHLDEATWYSPTPFLGLTYFGGVTESALKKGIPYLRGQHLIWGGGVAYSSKVLPGLSEWAHWVYAQTSYPHDDRMVSAFAEKSRQLTSVVTRAIFDQPVAESLIGHGGGMRSPKFTIANSRGPAYSVLPRFAVNNGGGAPDQRKWLANLGTPEEDTEWTFRVIRNGAVQRVRKDAA